MTEIRHIGMPRRSGRYPWGSGEQPFQSSSSFLGHVSEMKKKGLTDSEIADGLGMSRVQLQAYKASAKAQQRAADISEILRLKDKGLSNVAIAKKMGKNESSVRALLKEAEQPRKDKIKSTVDVLRDQLEKRGPIDIGLGVEQHLGVTGSNLAKAVAILEAEGYKYHLIYVKQAGSENSTHLKLLAPPGLTKGDLLKDPTKIKVPLVYDEDGSGNFKLIEPPTQVSSKRIAVRYGNEGGADRDGLIELRRGVDDISLLGKRYAQVRIAVDGTHYLKGMALYVDDLPPGVDIRFNTNKNKKPGETKLDVMKQVEDDPEMPFTSAVRQKHYIGKDGKRKLSALNIVNEEGNWENWSRTLSSQVLSKQSRTLARDQLAKVYDKFNTEYERISKLTNPMVRKKMLENLANECDSAATHLKAAALPRQKNQVLIPIPSMKDTEVYAPNFRNGEKVVLIRHPHGGIFEIPELTVNNRHAKAKNLLGSTVDAIGINPRVASKLSGADFDGDTVLVIPNNNRRVKSEPVRPALKNFDPKTSYPKYVGMKVMTEQQKGIEMGIISNLITDMTIKGATMPEIERAVKHSMVVIDAVKHKLNYKQSYIDNGIAQLKKTYQGSARGGASTIISRSSAPIDVPRRKGRPAAEGGPIDKKTGKKVWKLTGETYIDSKGRTVVKTVKSKRMLEVDDAHELSSGMPIEKVYADHANRLKRLGEKSRRDVVNTTRPRISTSAKKVYENEVASLNSKLNLAIKHAPLERKAQVLAAHIAGAKIDSNPHLEESNKQKIRARALEIARKRVGPPKQVIDITPKEWEAIQAGAISSSKLESIIEHANIDQVRKYATPRAVVKLTSSKLARARQMASNGYSRAEISDALGVSTTTLIDALKEGS